MLKKLIMALCVPSLISCGGGGGGGGSSGAEDNSWLSFNPAPIDVFGYVNEPISIDLTAKSSKTITETVNVAVIDSYGKFEPNISIKKSTDLEYTATLQTAKTLPVGTHTGKLEVRLCLDEPLTCKQPYPGSPWSLPYKIDVRAATNLTPLSASPSSAPWLVAGGNIARTSYIPETFDASKFSRRFKLRLADVPDDWDYTATPVVTNAGLVFYRSTANRSFTIYAISEELGTPVWTYSLGSDDALSDKYWPEPFISNGKLYAVWKGTHILDEKTGHLLSKETNSMKLLPDSDGFFGNSRTSLARFNPDLKSQTWGLIGTGILFSNNKAYTIDVSSTAADDSYYYVDYGIGMQAKRKSDGQGDYPTLIPDAEPISGIFLTKPVAGKDKSAYAIHFSQKYPITKLTKYDFNNNTVKWQVGSIIRSNPALTPDAIYVVNYDDKYGAVEARNPETGQVIWSWPIPEKEWANIEHSIVATKNIIFISTYSNVYAIDIATRKAVWSYPIRRGKLSISENGILYISSILQNLVAINLR